MTQFKYSLVSDLHVNHPQPKFPYDLLEEHVIVAGDTANGLEGLRFLEKLQNKGFKVYAVDGNHEHYSNVNRRRSVDKTRLKFQEQFPPLVDIDDSLTLIFANGWYPVQHPWEWFSYMNDGRYAVGEDPEAAAAEINAEHGFHALWVEDILETFHDRKFIVTTHTAPCEETLDPKYKGSPGNVWYWSPLMRQVLKRNADRILAWNHGHTHAQNHAVIDGVPVYVNPRGYPSENPDWKPQTISVEY